MGKTVITWILCAGVFLAISEISSESGVYHMQQNNNNYLVDQTPDTSTSVPDSRYTCSLSMFANDTFAYMACLAENALQRNWYPSPIGGLFSYQAWNGFDGFWQNGIILETMVNFMQYANHTRYKQVVTGAIRGLESLLEAYYPQPSYDDMAWYGLSYARTHEVLGGGEFLGRARQVYNWNWRNGWDTTVCGGGMWFDQTLGSKATITNVQMFQLGAKLYVLSGRQDPHLLNQVNATWQWIIKTGIIDQSNYSVYDAVSLDTCLSIAGTPWTYNSGVLIGALVLWANITDNSADLDLAHKLANSTIAHLSKDAVLTEQCDYSGCGDDNIVFKGIFARNLRYLIDVSDEPYRNSYISYLQNNAQVMLHNDTCWEKCDINYQDGQPYYNATTPVFDTNWHGPFNWTSPKQQVSALDLLVSTIEEGTTCTGGGCYYDPPTPPIKPLTCKNDPCPEGQQCCEYQGGFRTCCEASQKCIDGFCE